MKRKNKRTGIQKSGRNKKKYWKHGTELGDTEKQLNIAAVQKKETGEYERRQLKGKKDEELFVIEKNPVGFRHLKKAPENQELKCFSALKPSGTVLAFPSSSKRMKREFPKKSRKPVVATRSKSGAIRQKSQQTQEFSGKPEQATAFIDLWAQQTVMPGRTSNSIQIDPELEDYYLRQTKQRVPSLPKTDSRRKVRTLLPKVEVTHPGASYNPSYEDHQQLMIDLATVEEKKDAKQKQLLEKLRIPNREDMATEYTRQRELQEGLFDKEKLDPDEIKVEPHSSLDEDKGTPPVGVAAPDLGGGGGGCNRKTSSQRRKEKNQKLKQKQKCELKEKKRRMNDIFRLKGIKRQLDAEDEKIERKKVRRKEKEHEKLWKPAKLSRYNYEDLDGEVHLPDELPGCLRLLKPEGSLLEDRFKSLQRRNVIEVRQKQKHKRKYKLKTYVKRSHRADNVLPPSLEKSVD